MRISHNCFDNFVAKHSHNNRMSVARIFKCRKCFEHVLIFFANFFAKIFPNCRKTVAQLSYISRMMLVQVCSEAAAATFWQIYNATTSRKNVVQQTCDNLEQTCEQLATMASTIPPLLVYKISFCDCTSQILSDLVGISRDQFAHIAVHL